MKTRIEQKEFRSWTGRRIETLEKMQMQLELVDGKTKLEDYLESRGWKEVCDDFEADRSASARDS